MTGNTADERGVQGRDDRASRDDPPGSKTGDDRAESEERGALPLLRRSVLQMVGVGTVLGGSAEWATDRARASESPRPAPTDTDTADAGDVPRVARSLAADGRTVVVGAQSTANRRVERPEVTYVFANRNGSWVREAVLTPEERSVEFGSAVALDGDTALVGASRGPAPGGDPAGSVSVFTRTDGSWERTGRMVPADPSGIDRFGTAVALDGDTAVVGAKRDTNAAGFRVGAASIFTRSGSTWRRQSKVLPDEGVDRFGTTVAVDGDTAVVGARFDGDTPNDAGVAYVITRSRGGWTRTAKLTPPGDDRDDAFGQAVAVSGDTVVVGAPSETNDEGYNAGGAYVFTRERGRWRRQANLVATDAGSDTRFGSAVATDGDRVVVGAALGEDPRLSTGSAYVFDRSGSTWRRSSDVTPESIQRDGDVAIGDGTGVGVGDGTAHDTGSGTEVFDL